MARQVFFGGWLRERRRTLDLTQFELAQCAGCSISALRTPVSPRITSNLPIPPTPLMERETELASLAQLLRNPQCKLLTLVGPRGPARRVWPSSSRQPGR